MEELIALYLFKHKKCPLPEIGTLHVIESNAVAWYAEKKIEAPVPSVKLSGQVTETEDLISFISNRKDISREEAMVSLTEYCTALQNMDAFGETKLAQLGKFYVNADGNLIFKPIELPAALVPPVYAERVLHPMASHTLVVGDKETTSADMTAYYADSEDTTKSKWWIFALVFAATAITAIVLFLNEKNHSTTFGNKSQIQPTLTTITYRVAE